MPANDERVGSSPCRRGPSSLRLPSLPRAAPLVGTPRPEPPPVDATAEEEPTDRDRVALSIRVDVGLTLSWSYAHADVTGDFEITGWDKGSKKLQLQYNAVLLAFALETAVFLETTVFP